MINKGVALSLATKGKFPPFSMMLLLTPKLFLRLRAVSPDVTIANPVLVRLCNDSSFYNSRNWFKAQEARIKLNQTIHRSNQLVQRLLLFQSLCIDYLNEFVHQYTEGKKHSLDISHCRVFWGKFHPCKCYVGVWNKACSVFSFFYGHTTLRNGIILITLLTVQHPLNWPSA